MTSKREWNLSKVRMSKVTTSAVSTDLTDFTDLTKTSEAKAVSAESTIDPTPVGLKEKLPALVSRYGAEVDRYDETLEDVLTRQTYTPTERHRKVSAEVLADRFGIGLDE